MTLADGSYWVYLYDSLGQVASGKHYWNDGSPIPGQQFEYGFDAIGSVVQFAGYNGNGNAVEIVDGTNGGTTANFEYGPFVELVRSSRPLVTSDSFRFSTKYCDSESLLYYYVFRFYDPNRGTWISLDPMSVMSIESTQQQRLEPDLYAFVLNNSLNKIDSFGLITVGFYGADLWWTFPNGGNLEINKNAHAVGAKRMFHSLSIDAIFQYLLSQLDKNLDGKCTLGDGEEPIKIFGWSWGGVSAVKLAKRIKDNGSFGIKNIEIVATIDPVSYLRLPPTGVLSNVAFFWNRNQRHYKGVPLPFHGGELRIDDHGSTASDQLQLDPNGGMDGRHHVTIVCEEADELIEVLE